MHTYNAPYQDRRSAALVAPTAERRSTPPPRHPGPKLFGDRGDRGDRHTTRYRSVYLYTCIRICLHTYRCVLCICTICICTSKSDRRLVLFTLEPQRKISTTTTTTNTSITAAALHTTSTSTVANDASVVLLSSPPKLNRTDTEARLNPVCGWDSDNFVLWKDD